MSRIRSFLAREALIRRQRQELEALKTELANLRRRNTSMQAGMRRCLTCEYRESGRSANTPI